MCRNTNGEVHNIDLVTIVAEGSEGVDYWVIMMMMMMMMMMCLTVKWIGVGSERDAVITCH